MFFLDIFVFLGKNDHFKELQFLNNFCKVFRELVIIFFHDAITITYNQADLLILSKLNKVINAFKNSNLFTEIRVNALRKTFEFHIYEEASVLQFISVLQILDTEFCQSY